jgi:hypothetical protein
MRQILEFRPVKWSAFVRRFLSISIVGSAVVLAVSLASAGGVAACTRPSDVPPPASGRTLTVGPSGQYSTVQAAANAAQAGDNVQIAPGTYSGGLSIKNNGSSGNYVTFYGDGGTAVISGSTGISIGNHSWQRFIGVTSKGSSRFGANSNGAHDLVFQNFGIDGSQDGGLVALNTQNILVDGCDVHGTNARGTSADHEAMTMGSGSSNIEIKNCKVHDNGEEGIDVKYDDNAQAKIHDNVVTGNRGPNIYVDGSSHVQIYNNVSTGTTNNTKAGIMLAVENYSDSRKTDDIRVYNNVLTKNAQAGLDFWIEEDGTLSNIQVVNNTFFGNARGAVRFDTDSFDGQNVLRNNIYAEGNVSNGAFTSDHNVTGDPGFVNPGAGDFHLADGSKAIDTGSATGAPAFDLENHPRPAGAGYDIGAYER